MSHHRYLVCLDNQRRAPEEERFLHHYHCLDVIAQVIVSLSHYEPHSRPPVAKMASHAIFQYIVLAIDDTHNTWTNMIVKMIILRLLGSSDDKEKLGVARPEGPPLRGFRYPVSGRGSRGSRPSQVSGQRPEISSVSSTEKTDA